MLNLIKIQERLKDMPMQALMQYANGMNPQVPPFLALGELNRRKQIQEAAAAEQAKQMEGAPTVKEQIEQQAGLMALQGNRQRSALQQAVAQQANAPMPAPNTMETQPVQMARGGLAGAMNPDMMKKLMMLAAMKRGGIDRLPMRRDMFDRKDFAGGGIVAFANGGGAFTETNTGFYEQLPEEDKIDESKMSPRELLVYRALKEVRNRPDIAERRRQAGLPDIAPDTSARTRAELERREKALTDSDTFIDRLLALEPGRFGSGRLGKSMARYEQSRGAKLDEIKMLRAQAEDKKEEAERAFAEGRFKEGEADMDASRRLQMDAAGKMANIAKDEAQAKAAEASARSAGRVPVMEQVYADLKSGDPKRVQSAMTYLGQAKTGVISDEDALNQWNKLGFVEKNKLAKLSPPVTNAIEYKAYLERQRQGMGSSGSAQPSSRPPLTSFQK